jgi:hypothetical protein
VVNQLGKDQTKQIQYQFNDQGWRSSYNYNFVPKYAFFGASSVLGIGVNQKDIFPSLFEYSHNYGLAVSYTNQDIVNSICDFVSSELYTPTTKVAVVWSDRNPEQIEHAWHLLDHIDIFHFFCGKTVLQNKNNSSWPMIRNFDYGADGIHIGPKTHKIFHKILCNLFKR